MDRTTDRDTPKVIRMVTPATCRHVFEGWVFPRDREDAPHRRCLVCGLRQEQAVDA